MIRLPCQFEKIFMILACIVASSGSYLCSRAQTASTRPNCTVDKSGLCLREDYLIQFSDVLDIHLPFSPEYDETVTVQPDGFIRLREAAPIRAAGLKVSELESAIIRSYSGILREPAVSVVLKDFQKPSFFASGEVGRPGRYDLRSDLTLMQAISEAGGMPNERASKKQVIVFHPQGNNTYRTTVVNLDALLKMKVVPEDLVIRPGDIIYVPQNRMSKLSRFLPSPSVGAYVGPSAF